MMIMNATSEIGHMLVDESYCPTGVTQEDIMNFLTVIITEYELSYQLKNSNLIEMKSDISDYFDYCTSEKDKLLAEEASAAAAEIVAGAAMIAAAATAWIPGVNFALSAVSIAAQATAMGLEIAAEKLQETVVEDISNADEKIRLKPSFENIKGYLDAQTSNTKFFPRLQLGMTILEFRAAFFGSVIAASKELGRKVTNEDLKKVFVDWYTTTKNFPSVIAEFTKLYDELEDSPDDLDSFTKKLDAYVSTIPSIHRDICVSTVLSLTVTITIQKGRSSYYRVYKQVNQWAKAIKIGMKDLDSEGDMVEAGMDSGEVEVLTGVQAYSMAVSYLAGVAGIVFGSLQAVEAAKTEKILTKAISDTQDAIVNYYEKLVHRSTDDN